MHKKPAKKIEVKDAEWRNSACVISTNVAASSGGL
jgi:hypothetical protein